MASNLNYIINIRSVNMFYITASKFLKNSIFRRLIKGT